MAWNFETGCIWDDWFCGQGMEFLKNWQSIARDLRDNPKNDQTEVYTNAEWTRFTLAEKIKEEFRLYLEKAYPKHDVISILIESAIDDVDWMELSTHLLYTLKKGVELP